MFKFRKSRIKIITEFKISFKVEMAIQPCNKTIIIK